MSDRKPPSETELEELLARLMKARDDARDAGMAMEAYFVDMAAVSLASQMLKRFGDSRT